MVTVSSLPIWQAGSEQFYRPCGLVESKLLPMAIEMLTDKVPNLVPDLVPNLVLQAAKALGQVGALPISYGDLPEIP